MSEQAQSLRIGVIGCGGIAQHAHLPSISRIDEDELAAVSDVYADVAARVAVANGLPAARGFDDHRRILDDGAIDAVCVCAPTTQHARITVEALEAGKHVLVEKPMAVDAAEAQTMIDAADRAGRILMVAYNHTYDPATMRLKQMIDDGDLGEILCAEGFFIEDLYAWTAGANASTIRSENQKSFWPQYDNAFETMREFIHNFGSHVTNVLRVLLGEAEAIRYAKGDPERQFLAVLDYGAFPVLFKNVRVKQAEFEKGVEIYGTRKRVRLEFAPPLERYNPGRLIIADTKELVTTIPFLGFGWPFEQEHRHFAQCVLEGKTPLTDGRQAIGDVRLAEDLSRIGTSD